MSPPVSLINWIIWMYVLRVRKGSGVRGTAQRLVRKLKENIGGLKAVQQVTLQCPLSFVSVLCQLSLWCSVSLLPSVVSRRAAWAQVASPTGSELLLHTHTYSSWSSKWIKISCCKENVQRRYSNLNQNNVRHVTTIVRFWFHTPGHISSRFQISKTWNVRVLTDSWQNTCINCDRWVILPSGPDITADICSWVSLLARDVFQTTPF